jgi:hypothetical protein
MRDLDEFYSLWNSAIGLFANGVIGSHETQVSKAARSPRWKRKELKGTHEQVTGDRGIACEGEDDQ